MAIDWQLAFDGSYACSWLLNIPWGLIWTGCVLMFPETA